MKKLIKNHKLITPYKIEEGYSLSIVNGKIADILEKGQAEETVFDQVIDLQGKYLAPGFIDIHNHGNYGHDAMEATYEALASMSEFHLKNGVTGYLATTMTSSFDSIVGAIKNGVDYIQAGKKGARVLGLYLEGPYFSQAQRGAQPSKYIRDPDMEELKSFIKAGAGNIRIISLAPELNGVKEVITFARQQGIVVAAGHTNATYTKTMKGVESGITQATHFYNGMRSFSHREPGIIGAVFTDERVTIEMICDGIHLHPAAMKMAFAIKGKDKIILISDAMMATGLADGGYDLGGQDVLVAGGVARLQNGSLAGSTITLNRAVYNAVHLVGVPLQQAIQMVTLNPARAIGVDKFKGSIEIGKDADLVAFNDNLDITFAMVGGKIECCPGEKNSN